MYANPNKTKIFIPDTFLLKEEAMQIQRSPRLSHMRTSSTRRARIARLMVLASTLLLAALLAAFVLYPAGQGSTTTIHFSHSISQQIAGSGPGDSPPSTPTPTPTP
jgi:hypothetical protein